jgi:hypothetical protein
MTRRARDEPVRLGDSIAAVSAELGLPEHDRVSAFVTAWPDVVGPAVAQHARIRTVRDGVCTIAVDGAPWATQLRYLEAQVVERAAGLAGPGLVTSLKIVVEPLRRPG